MSPLYVFSSLTGAAVYEKGISGGLRLLTFVGIDEVTSLFPGRIVLWQ